MIKGLEALEELKFQVGNITYFTRDLQITTFKVRDSGLFEVIGKELTALEIIKKFVWVEDGEIHLGLYGDSEIILKENDFESKEEYNLLKEVLL